MFILHVNVNYNRNIFKFDTSLYIGTFDYETRDYSRDHSVLNGPHSSHTRYVSEYSKIKSLGNMYVIVFS